MCDRIRCMTVCAYRDKRRMSEPTRAACPNPRPREIRAKRSVARCRSVARRQRAARGRGRARGRRRTARDLDDEGGGRRATRARTGGLTRRERARAEFGGVRRGDRRGGARGGEGVELRIRSRVGEVRGRSDATRNDATRNDATRATRARRARARAMMRMGIDRGFRRRFARSSNKGKLWKDVEKRLELE